MSDALATLTAIVAKMPGLNKPRIDFITHTLRLFLCLKCRINFLMLARHSNHYVESTYRLQFEEHFDFATMNIAYIRQHGSGHFLWAFDASYLPKSGQKTPGVGKYWSGSAARALWGLELGLLSLVDIDYHTAFHVDALLTPGPDERKAKDIDLPDHYSQAILYQRHQLADLSRYLAVDAYFAKREFIQQIRQRSDLHLISLLRQDANLKYRYQGPKRAARGAPKRYTGKVNLTVLDLTQVELVRESKQERLYTVVVYCVFLKADIRLAYLQELDESGQVKRYRPYFSTDTGLSAELIVRYYQARFQQEFLIRDAKQYTGLSASQARSVNKLDCHVNLSLSAVNIAKVESGLSRDAAQRKAFSLHSVTTRYHNQLLLEGFMSNLPVEAKMLIKPVKCVSSTALAVSQRRNHRTIVSRRVSRNK
jgi:hypothetical protein